MCDKNCDRCGCELFDFYYMSFAHYRNNEEGHFYLCPECMFKIKEVLGEKVKVEARHIKKSVDNKTYTVSFELPDGYDIIRG